MIRFERFDSSSQDAMARCYEIQQRYQSNMVDSAHVLMALIEQNATSTSQILTWLKVDIPRLQTGVDQVLKQQPQGRLGQKGEVFITPHTKRVIELAHATATHDQAPAIDVSYLFRAIAAERDTPLAQLLAEHSITPASVDEALRGE